MSLFSLTLNWGLALASGDPIFQIGRAAVRRYSEKNCGKPLKFLCWDTEHWVPGWAFVWPGGSGHWPETCSRREEQPSHHCTNPLASRDWVLIFYGERAQCCGLTAKLQIQTCVHTSAPPMTMWPQTSHLFCTSVSSTTKWSLGSTQWVAAMINIIGETCPVFVFWYFSSCSSEIWGFFLMITQIAFLHPCHPLFSYSREIR